MRAGRWRQKLLSLGAEFGTGASEAEVRALSQQLRFTIEPQFAAFLQDVGWVELGDLTIAGAGPDVPEEVRLATIAADAWREGAPEEYLAFADDGGDIFFIHRDEGAIYIEGDEFLPVARSFNDWLDETLADFEDGDE